MTAVPLTVRVARDAWGTVEVAVRQNGSCPAKDFLQTDCELIRKNKSEPSSTARAQFMALFQELAKNGTLPTKRFDYIGDKLWEVRQEIKNKQIRFLAFLDGKQWILTNGFVKPGAKKGLGKTPPHYITRGQQIMGEYWERKNAIDAAKKKE